MHQVDRLLSLDGYCQLQGSREGGAAAPGQLLLRFRVASFSSPAHTIAEPELLSEVRLAPDGVSSGTHPKDTCLPSLRLAGA